jgi:glucosylceramidase
MTSRRDAVKLLGSAAILGPTIAKAAQASAPQGAAPAKATAVSGTWRSFTSAPDTPRFVPAALGATGAAAQPVETDTAVFIDTRQRDQTIFGFGGAITDAVAEVYASLQPQAQRDFVAAYFDPRDGIGYTVVRTSIHSSDFGSDSYTYVAENDRTLASFDIGHDRKLRIPLLRQVLAASAAHGNPVRVFATPWSAPAWMKSNNSMLGGGSLLPAYRDVWASYIVKFVHAYEQAGVPIWGLTVQNEPMATQRWESMIFTADEETRFLGDHLGPALKKAGLGSKKIMVWDHNRDLLPQRAGHLLADAKARPYVWGVGYHWYETWTGGAPMHRNVAAVHAAYPQVNLLMTEGCIEKFDAAKLQSWDNAERYAREMIGDLNAGAVGWVDWNMLLDSRGGPNHKNNLCFAPLHSNSEGQLVFTPIYTALGHFSRFIRPGARRVGAATSRSTLDATAFRNLDGTLAIVVMNRTATAQTYTLQIDAKATTVAIPPRGLQTIIA